MFETLIVTGPIICVIQFMLVKKGLEKTSLFLAILYSFFVLLIFLSGLTVPLLKIYLPIIAVTLFALFFWVSPHKTNKLIQE
nr:hypothetical protein [Paenibacillus bovis]